MTQANKILKQIEELRKSVEVMALHVDAGNSSMWKAVYSNIDNSYQILKRDKRIYGW